MKPCISKIDVKFLWHDTHAMLIKPKHFTNIQVAPPTRIQVAPLTSI